MNIDPNILNAINEPGPVKYSFEESDFDGGPVPMAFMIISTFGNKFAGDPLTHGRVVGSVEEANAFMSETNSAMLRTKRDMYLGYRALALAFLDFMLRLEAKDFGPEMDRLARLAGIGIAILERGVEELECPPVWPDDTRQELESYIQDVSLESLVERAIRAAKEPGE